MEGNSSPSFEKLHHVVHVSYDADVFDPSAAQDSRERQMAHARCLEQRLPGVRTTLIVLSSREDLTHEIIGNLILLPRRDFRLRHLPRLFWCLRKIHRTHPISLITTQDMQGLFWAPLAFGRLAGIPVIGQSHTDLSSEESRKENLVDTYGSLYEWVTLKLLKFYDGFRVVNTASKDFLLDLGVKKPIAVVPVSVTLPVAGPGAGAAAWQCENALRILYVGRMVPVKNLGLWLETARLALESEENLEFVLVGDGPAYGSTRQTRDEMGLQERVRLVGSTGPEQLVDWYRTADVLLLTSHNEGFGRVVVEAMFNETVPVCTDISGPRDIIGADDCGFLVDKKPAALAQCILDLARDRSRLALMKQNARQKAVEKFAPEQLRLQWIDFMAGFVAPFSPSEV